MRYQMAQIISGGSPERCSQIPDGYLRQIWSIFDDIAAPDREAVTGEEIDIPASQPTVMIIKSIGIRAPISFLIIIKMGQRA
ncbi:MAG: hypothetical protein PHT33_11600 [bacterium]|nr:hypothetical protein [bacterium]